MADNRELWNRVDELRGKMSIRELAERSNVSEATLQTTRSLGTQPKLQLLYPLAQALGTTVEYLYTGKSNDSYPDNEVFRKISSSQLLFDITTKLAEATPEEVEMVRRVLEIPKPAYMQ